MYNNFYRSRNTSLELSSLGKDGFDMNSRDVMVFLHIQKTGGTSFGRHLVRDLDLQRGCQCRRLVFVLLFLMDNQVSCQGVEYPNDRSGRWRA